MPRTHFKMWFDKLTTNGKRQFPVRPEPVEGHNSDANIIFKLPLSRRRRQLGPGNQHTEK